MDRKAAAQKGRLGDPTVTLLVSLYFILAAFFIVLNAISNQQLARSVAVVESLEKAFERPFPTKADEPGILPPAAHVSNDSVFLLSLGQLAAEFLGEDAYWPTQGGNVLLLSADVHALFYTNSPQLSAQAPAFIDRLADVLSKAPVGERYQVAFLFGRQGEEGGLAFRRADQLARLMVDAGIDARSVAVGLDRDAPARTLSLRFSILDVPASASEGAL